MIWITGVILPEALQWSAQLRDCRQSWKGHTPRVVCIAGMAGKQSRKILWRPRGVGRETKEGTWSFLNRVPVLFSCIEIAWCNEFALWLMSHHRRTSFWLLALRHSLDLVWLKWQLNSFAIFNSHWYRMKHAFPPLSTVPDYP